MAKTPAGALSVYPIRVDPHHDRRHGSIVVGAPMLARQHHQHPEWRLDPDEVDWGKFGGHVLDASYSVLPNLRAISVAPTFNRLTVLSVRASGLVSIDLLQSCARLVYLDLSSNKITHLGDSSFWASFPDLLVILLHGNMVSEWEAVGSLGRAPQLTYLTLFSNPVSRRRMYRTFTTNCCESLRGLDLHAVSDEEVVEGSPFSKSSRWSTCSSALALPQPLFKGLTEVALDSARDECAKPGRSVLPMTTKGGGDCHPRNSSKGDTSIASSVSRRVGLLRKFHARNSPVVIVQRQVRRYICHQAVVAAAVKIQSCVRKWIVKLQATNALQHILRMRGELHLVQEILTPTQLRSLSFFQRRIAGHFRVKMLVTCTQTLERFMGNVARRFLAFVARLDRAQLGGVVVTSDAAGELAAAVTKALMVTQKGLTWDEAAEQTVGMISTVANCRLLRPFSYNDVPSRLALEKDIHTDGIFITRSPVGSRLRAEPRHVCSRSLAGTTTSSPTRPFSGLRDPKRHSKVRRRAGVFGSPRVIECNISRRNASVRCSYLSQVEGDGSKMKEGGIEKQLWIFRPTEIHVLARVLRSLRNPSVANHPVPYILERHLFRCAAATRLQAAWRGHVLRWNLVDTLASCLIVARAGVCIQRWWRYHTGLGARLRLCRRLWALASVVSTPTLFMELDVFFTLTRGWRWAKDKDDIEFSFESGDRVAVVSKTIDTPLGAFKEEVAACGKGTTNAEQTYGPDRCAERPACRELPLCARGSFVRELLLSDLQHRRVLRHVGALLTEGVEVKKIVWPVAAAAAIAGASEPAAESSTHNSACRGLPQLDGDDKPSIPSNYTDIWVDSERSVASGETCPGMAQQGISGEDSGPPVDLRKSHGGVDMVELTFSNVQEAKARALLLVLATEEPGVLANRPVAQLMTLGMLRRAAAGGPGQASSTPKKTAQIYERGDAVEVSVLKLSQGYGGTWLPGKIAQQTGSGATYTVTLDNGRVEQQIPGDRLRPLDRTGIEIALVEMSHLPSRWQRAARSLSTPADRLELELLRRSLLTTTPVQYSAEGPPQLLRVASPPDVDATLTNGLSHNFDGLSGRRIPVQMRLCSQGGAAGRDDAPPGPPPPRWAGSQTMTAAKGQGGPAAKDLDKVARAAAAEDEATAASTWVPGNRFRRDLEKLVHLAARNSQDVAKEKQLSARREKVCRARNVERGGPSPRDRLEKLKAVDVAIFRRESDALKDKSASEKARDGASRALNVAAVKESMRDGKQLAKSWVEDRQEQQTADAKRREEEVEVARDRQLEKREADVAAAKARAKQRQAARSKKALYVAESNAFTANTSQLTRYVGKYATTSHKSQKARGMRMWVKGKKVHEEDKRRRMLRRVQELQEQKRSDALRQRRVLAARGKARAAMDEAVVRHRLGTLTSSGGGLTDDVIQVLRPSSRLPVESSSNDVAFETGCTLSPWRDEYDQNDGIAPREAFPVRGLDDDAVPHLETTVFETSGDLGKGEGVRPADRCADVDGKIAAAPLDGVALPSKPDNPPSRGCQQRNRRFRENDTGNNRVVLANVPTVSAEPRASSSPGTGGGLFGRPRSSHAKLSLLLQRGLDNKGRGVSMGPAAPSGKEQLPWPLGRRCV